MEYRLFPGACEGAGGIDGVTGECLKAMPAARADAQAAVRGLRQNAAALRLDPGRIAAGGSSAGAVTAIHTVLWPDRYSGTGTYDDPSHVEAAVSRVDHDGRLSVVAPAHDAGVVDVVETAHGEAPCRAARDRRVQADRVASPGRLFP